MTGKSNKRRKHKGYTKAVRNYFFENGKIKRSAMGMKRAITVDDVMVMVGLDPTNPRNRKSRPAIQVAIYNVFKEIHAQYNRIVCGGFSSKPRKYTATALKSEALKIAQANVGNNIGRIESQARKSIKHFSSLDQVAMYRANGAMAGLFPKTKRPVQAELLLDDEEKEA